MDSLFDNAKGENKDGIITFNPPIKVSLADWYKKAMGRKAIVQENSENDSYILIYYISENADYNNKLHSYYLSHFVNDNQYDLLTGINYVEGAEYLGGIF